MDECPYCEMEIDAQELYEEGDLDDEGNLRCPHCGRAISIRKEMSYKYYVEVG